MDVSTLNWLAIIAAALSNFLIGGLWYSPVLFGNLWMKENKFSDDDLKRGNMVKIFGLTFVFTFVMAFNLAMYLNDSSTTAIWGAIAGFLAGFGWVAMAIFIIGQFERKSTKYMLIHGGYVIISFVLMGLIIGLWQPVIEKQTASSQIDTLPSGELTLTQSIIINTSVDKVWKSYTEPEEWKKWVTPVVEMDFKINGTIKSHYDSTATIGDKGTIVNHILNYIPYRQITMQAELNENFPEFMVGEEKNLYSIVI